MESFLINLSKNPGLLSLTQALPNDAPAYRGSIHSRSSVCWNACWMLPLNGRKG
jgi:hypothetical protein